MTLKIMGAIFVIIACSAMGFAKVAGCRREEKLLQKLILTLEYMESELQYRHHSLPELCRTAASYAGGLVGAVMLQLGEELDRQLLPEAESCMRVVLSRMAMPGSLKKQLRLLGKTLGRFHLDGQLTGFHTVKELCRRELDRLSTQHAQALRSYQTLGICAGVALVILFI